MRTDTNASRSVARSSWVRKIEIVRHLPFLDLRGLGRRRAGLRRIADRDGDVNVTGEMGLAPPKWSGSAAERQQRRNDLLQRLKQEEVTKDDKQLPSHTRIYSRGYSRRCLRRIRSLRELAHPPRA